MSHRPISTWHGRFTRSLEGTGRQPMRQEGFTLLEIAVYLTLLLVLGAPFLSIALLSARSTSENDTMTRVEERNRTAVFRIEKEVRKGISGTLAVSNGGLTLTFTSAAGFDGTSVTPGPQIRFTLRTSTGETLNGADDNQNGTADEGELVRTDLSTGVQTALTGSIDIASSGFVMAGQGVNVTVANFGSLDRRYGTFSASRSLTVYARN